MEASLAVQTRIVARLRESRAVLQLVPFGNIFDRSARPERFPCVIVGEGDVVGDDDDCHVMSEVSATLHVWAADQSFETVKLISGAVRRAIRKLDTDAELGGFVIGPVEFEAAATFATRTASTPTPC